MKQYTAIYNTEKLKNIQYAFQAEDRNMAKRFCFWKFSTTDIVIRDEETSEEFPLVDGVFEKVNDHVIIASDQAMIDAGLIKCTAREDQITLWAYIFSSIYKNWSWAPIMRVFAEPLKEDIKDNEGRVIDPKSTHKIAGFYGALVYGDLDLSRFLANRNVPVEKL